MKTILFPVICCLILAASCKKEKEEPKAPGLAGYWVGKYSYYSTDYPTSYFAFLFKPDSTLRVYTNADTTVGYRGNGTYTLKGDSVKAYYVLSGAPFNADRNIRMIKNPQFTFMEGQGGLGMMASDLGPAYLVKQ